MTRWTPEEEATLRRCYPSEPPEVLRQALPGRSLRAIYVRAHQLKLIGRKRGPNRQAETERFWRYVQKTDTCWNWTGWRAGGGLQDYGMFRIGSQADGTRQQVYAHRWIWEHLKGAIPDGLQVNHHCDNSLCVHPAHLYLGTPSENSADVDRRGPNPRACRGRQGFIIAVDTRERHPYHFAVSELRRLKTGDYSIVDLEEQITIERKRLDELFSIAGRERERFERELERMAKLDYAALVIEADLPRILRGAAFSQVSPKAVIQSLVSWSIRYRVQVFFAGDRQHANALTCRVLEKYWKYHHELLAKGSAG